MVHLLLVLSQDEEMKNIEFQNMAFASPLFGNLDLKKNILKHPDLRLRNMYHFVNCEDMIPAATIIEETYDNLSWGAKQIANSSELLLNLFYEFFRTLGFDKYKDLKKKLEVKLENVLIALNERKNLINEPLYENRGSNTYMPIGHFILMKKKESGQSELHVFDLEESMEDSEHQWVSQILVKFLEIIGEVYVFNKPLKQAKKIVSAHALEENYFAQVANCLSSGVYDNFDDWKSATEDSQKNQSPPQKIRRLENQRLERMNASHQ